jgi:hypothetical protein
MNINKLIFKATLFVLSIFVISSSVFAATFHVDAVNGNDSSNGLSETTAWKTIAKVNASRFNPGDQILLKRGETWRETLIVSSSGSAGNPITFGAYGSGEKPVITGADVISGWSLEFGNVYSSMHSNAPHVVMIDTEPGLPASTLDSLDQNYKWFASKNKIYLYSSMGDPNKVYTKIEAGVRPICINVNKQQYLIFDGLCINGANDIDLDRGAIDEFDKSGTKKNWIIIRNCEIGPTAGNGIRIASFDGTTIKNIKIHDNYIHHCRSKLIGDAGTSGAYGIIFPGNSIIRQVEIYNNRITHCFHGCRLMNITSSAFYLNKMEENGTEANILVGPNAQNINIYRNIVKNTPSEAIWIGSTNIKSVYIYYNLFYNLTNFSVCVVASGADSVFFYNNTIYNSQNSAFALGSAGRVSNIKIENNIINKIKSLGLNLDWYNNSTFTSDFNCWDENKGFWNGASSTLYGWADWVGTLGHDKNSFYQDPIFTDPENEDFSLKVSSKLMDKGLSIRYGEDFFGNKVPNNGKTDIGAIEYGSKINKPMSLHLILSNE